MWHIVPYFTFTSPGSPTLSPRAGRLPLPLLDLLFSLVRVRLMPLSMLIVHRSKVAFIKMIKCSQTPAEYLKASGRTTWQVTTSHTNSPRPAPPTFQLPCCQWRLVVTGSCFEFHRHPLRNYEEMKGVTCEINFSTHMHNNIILPIPTVFNAQRELEYLVYNS